MPVNIRLAVASSILLLCLVAQTGAAQAIDLHGVYNTGPSLHDEANEASLNIRFHPCTDNNALLCASVVGVVEPNGPSGQDMLPDGNPVLGFVVITGLKPKGKGKYRGGEITALDESIIEGKMIRYGIKIDDTAGGALKARGCLGFICPRKMIWTIVEESVAAGAVNKEP